MARRRPTAHVAHPAQNALFAMTDLPTSAAPRRLFTALFPPPEACAAIDAERQRWPGLPRRLHPVLGRMHLTLQFFNAVDAPHERDWLAAMQTLRFAPFDIALTQAELWRAPSGVIAVLVPEHTPELAALHRATAQLARQASLPAASNGFKPHLTTLRHAERTTLAPLTEPIRWTVRQVDLIWSDLKAQPPQYHRLGQFGCRAP